MKYLKITLLSDATFGSGDSVSGWLDDEVEYDHVTGLPQLKGRTFKGLLVEECSNVLFSLQQCQSSALSQFESHARYLFGQAGSTSTDEGALHIGNAGFPASVTTAVAATVANGVVSASEVLESWTVIRRRSAVDEETGAPQAETLRAARAVTRGTHLYAGLMELDTINDVQWSLVAAAASVVRRAGKGRNRGSGHIKCSLEENGDDITRTLLHGFCQAANLM